jgi:hypothetical protein
MKFAEQHSPKSVSYYGCVSFFSRREADGEMAVLGLTALSDLFDFGELNSLQKYLKLRPSPVAS